MTFSASCCLVTADVEFLVTRKEVSWDLYKIKLAVSPNFINTLHIQNQQRVLFRVRFSVWLCRDAPVSARASENRQIDQALAVYSKLVGWFWTKRWSMLESWLAAAAKLFSIQKLQVKTAWLNKLFWIRNERTVHGWCFHEKGVEKIVRCKHARRKINGPKPAADPCVYLRHIRRYIIF